MLLHNNRYATRFSMYRSSYMVEGLVNEAKGFIINGDPLPDDLITRMEFAGIDIDALRQYLHMEDNG